MKKTTISFLTLIALMAGVLYSCNSNEEDTIINPSNQSAASNSIFAKLGDDPVLFTYETDKEYVEKMGTVMPVLANDTKQEMQTPDVDKIINIVFVEKGTAILAEIHYLNFAKDTFIKSKIFNPGTGGYDTVNVDTPFSGGPVTNFPILGMLQGGCPDGYIEVGECMHGDEYGQCIGTYAGMFAQAGSEGNASSMTLTMQTNHLGTYICGTTSNM